MPLGVSLDARLPCVFRFDPSLFDGTSVSTTVSLCDTVAVISNRGCLLGSHSSLHVLVSCHSPPFLSVLECQPPTLQISALQLGVLPVQDWKFVVLLCRLNCRIAMPLRLAAKRLIFHEAQAIQPVFFGWSSCLFEFWPTSDFKNTLNHFLFGFISRHTVFPRVI